MSGALYAARWETPIGPLTALVDDGGALTRLLFAREPAPAEAAVAWDEGRCAHVGAQLDEYFRGERRAFDLPLAPRGTEFQRRVWSALPRIPYGRTLEYRELAEAIGKPGAFRAAGRANATNPIPIIIPCHRVVGADGSLTGYGGGIEVKERLLRLEGAEVEKGRATPASRLAGAAPGNGWMEIVSRSA
jgi:methylated-DNA-[protein]-cysteine S-methyltransferase